MLPNHGSWWLDNIGVHGIIKSIHNTMTWIKLIEVFLLNETEIITLGIFWLNDIFRINLVTHFVISQSSFICSKYLQDLGFGLIAYLFHIYIEHSWYVSFIL